MAETLSALLVPDHLRTVEGLALMARRTVTTLLPGLNRSTRTRPGLEFSQYRNYQPGDDLRFLDWKLFARSDRFFIREAQHESHLTIRFVLDASASMLHEDQGMQKIDYARYLIATLAWLARQQGDRIALHAISGHALHQVPPGSSHRHFSRFLYQLLAIDCAGQFPMTIVENGLEGARQKNEIILFISDLYERAEELSATLQRLSYSQNELLVFHLMARNELAFNYRGAVTLEDLETGDRIQVDAGSYRKTYQKQLEQRLSDIKDAVMDRQALYTLVATDEHPGQALRAFLQQRNKLL
jgi:uncharacterized protein (DUF58 family)